MYSTIDLYHQWTQLIKQTNAVPAKTLNSFYVGGCGTKDQLRKKRCCIIVGHKGAIREREMRFACIKIQLLMEMRFGKS